MGRPLYTTALLARYATEAIHNEPPKPTYPHVEKWSRWNPFDPDSDEFFDSDSAVYEAFLIEEEIAERAQTQQRETARLFAETLLREAEADSSSASSSNAGESDPLAISGGVVRTSRPPAMQMEIDSLDGVRNEHVAHDGARRGLENGRTEIQPARRRSRRSSAVFEWREITPAPTEMAVPHISVVPVEPVNLTRAPSPDPLNLVSGLEHLSESPRPLVPTGLSDRAISPIPNTPARVSGVFATPPSTGTTVNPSSPISVTPRILSWGSDGRSQWLPESPTPAPPGMFHYMRSRLPAASAPLSY